jgi:lauroyl/myristoyl acyltransferase
MRKLNVWLGAAFWALVAVLMPMSALEPIATAHASRLEAAPLAASVCDDGSARLAMGCESIHL